MLIPALVVASACLAAVPNAPMLGQPASERQARSRQPPAEMQKLDFLVGEWEGTAAFTAPGGRIEGIRQTEKVQRKLNGRVLLVEGEGRVAAPGQDERIVFEALGTISYDAKTGRYLMRAYGPEGQVDPELEVGDKRLVWSFTTPDGNDLRYTVTLDERGHWIEIGERRVGETWRTFMEMDLTRKGGEAAR